MVKNKLSPELILDIINKNPGISSVDLNLSIYKQTHPKEVDYFELHDMIEDLVFSYQVRRLMVAGKDWSKSFYFPNNSRFHFE